MSQNAVKQASVSDKKTESSYFSPLDALKKTKLSLK